MSWNNGTETKKFKEKQKRQDEQYRSLGMSEEAIKEINAFDLEVFKSERRYRMHTQQFEPSDFNDNCDNIEKLSIYDISADNLTASIDSYSNYSRYWWIEELDNSILVKKVKSLSCEDKELLTMLAFDGYNQTEIAALLGTSKQAISKKIMCIRKKLNFF